MKTPRPSTNRVEVFAARQRRRLVRVLPFIGRLFLVLVGIELMAFAALSAHDFLRPDPPVVEEEAPSDAWRGLDVFANVSWAEDYFSEFDAAYELHYAPYVGYRRPPFRGNYINVDTAGVRRTVPDCGAGSDRSLRVFFLGGSAVWGTGARDEATIPSIVARGLCATGVPVKVTNFGESGYTNTQEVIQLQLALQRGEIPDVVIFYDGVNDVFSSYQNGAAGLPQNVRDRVQARITRDRGDPPGRLHQLVALTSTGELATRLLSRWQDSDESVPEPWSPPTGEEALRLDRQTVDVLVENMRIVRGLEAQYGFDAFFYWQPAIYNKATLSDHERHRIRKDAAWGDMYLRVTELVAELDWMRDLTSVFDDEPGSVFIDEFHISEAGNREIGALILEDVMEHLAGPRPGTDGRADRFMVPGPPATSLERSRRRRAGPGTPRRATAQLLLRQSIS